MNDGGVYNLQKADRALGYSHIRLGKLAGFRHRAGVVESIHDIDESTAHDYRPMDARCPNRCKCVRSRREIGSAFIGPGSIDQCYLSHQAANDKSKAHAGRTLLYFTMGENKWKRTRVWPIPGTVQERYYLEAGNLLAAAAPTDSGQDTYNVDFEASAGPANRWVDPSQRRCRSHRLWRPFDRRSQTSHLHTGEPLSRDMEMTGQPVITLRVISTATDGNFFAYLEDVAPSGKTTYITEGELRALHRKLSDETPPYKTTYPYRTFSKHDAEALVPGRVATLTFQLQATSVLFRKGHRIRLAIAGPTRACSSAFQRRAKSRFV